MDNNSDEEIIKNEIKRLTTIEAVGKDSVSFKNG